MSTWQVERSFHNWKSNRQPLPWNLGISPSSFGNLGSSRSWDMQFPMWSNSQQSHLWRSVGGIFNNTSGNQNKIDGHPSSSSKCYHWYDLKLLTCNMICLEHYFLGTCRKEVWAWHILDLNWLQEGSFSCSDLGRLSSCCTLQLSLICLSWTSQSCSRVPASCKVCTVQVLFAYFS